MPTLNGPWYEENFTDRDRLFSRFRYQKGITLLVKGIEVTQAIYPYQGDLLSGEYDHIYEGGHIHEISEEQKTILVNAGYGEWITG